MRRPREEHLQHVGAPWFLSSRFWGQEPEKVRQRGDPDTEQMVQDYGE